MGDQLVPPVARLACHALDRRNPLVRSGDRLEALVLVVAVLVSLFAVPFIAAIGSTVYVSRSVESTVQVATRHQAVAVLLVDAPPLTRTVAQAGGVQVSNVAASWELPDGSTRTGEVAASNGTKAGAAVRIWLDDKGNVIDAPVLPVGAGVTAVVVALALWSTVVGVLAALCALVRWGTRRAALRRWADEWAAIGPGWTGRPR